MKAVSSIYLRSRIPRRPIQPDLIPVVSLALILLTSLLIVHRPQGSLELVLPPRLDRGTPVAESVLLSMRVGMSGGEPRITWHRGRYPSRESNVEYVRSLLLEEKQKAGEDLIVLFSAERGVPYGSVVQVLDAVRQARLKFAMVPEGSRLVPFPNRIR